MFEKLLKKELGVNCISEFRFHPTRKWRADYAIEQHKILIEVEGGLWGYGRHNRALGFIKDMEKYNTATSLGWSVLRIQPKELLLRSTLDLVEQTIKNKNANQDTTGK